MSYLPKQKVKREFGPGVPVTKQIRYRGVLYNLKKATMGINNAIIATYALP